MSDWEGKDRRAKPRGRPTLGDERAEIRIVLRVTKAQYDALQRAATDNQHEHLATYLRELLDAGVLESQDTAIFTRAS